MEQPPSARVDRFVHAPPTAETVERFLDLLAVEGRITPEQARLWKTAVRRLGSVRRDNEPDNAEWLADHLDDLVERSVHGESGTKRSSVGTARTYRSRAGAALREFLAMRRNPVAYSNRVQHVTDGNEAELRGRVLTCRLGPRRVFRYQLPPNGLSRNDIERIALHLWSQSEDFDEAKKPPGQLLLFGEQR